MLRILSSALLCLSLASCTSPNTHVAERQFGSSATLVTTGNLRLVTERQRAGYPPVVCTEPSPDYAIAFGNNRVIKASETAADASKRDATADFSSTEQVTKGEGREAAVLALRDGLYTACQSYANGVIGHDAYAIILSQYGALLVALVGNDDVVAGADGKAAAAKTVAKAATDTGRQATLSALLVACISSNDNTRAGGPTNTLLNPRFCHEVLSRALLRATAG